MQMTYAEAIRDGLRVELKRDPKVYMAGEDIGPFGGCFGVTAGLYDEFGPKRIVETPISENFIVGHAVGSSACGLRPVVEVMFDDFITVCFDEFANQAAKNRYMFGGKSKVPMVCLTINGAGVGAAAQHSQSLEALLTHIPGLITVIPSTPYDAKGLLISSIRDDNPVLYYEHKQLLGLTGEVPEGEYSIPLGKADIKRKGADVTIVTWSWMVQKSLAAAEALAKEGINAEVIDPRTLIPLDKEAILESVGKTGKLVIAHEAVKTMGFGAEIAAMVAEEGFDLLKAPIIRIGAPYCPIPFSPTLEQAYIPSEEGIAAAVKSMF
ncbi:MAG TPA: alpha-ketoacid dehydrogenase subunit beta [Syntrophomonadaceae bacterium]|nr:alpha-ketoacid dehydrogenase subunit beta [Syntrophomonadaceae bacterium]